MPKLTFPYIDFDSQYIISMTPEHHLRQLGGSYTWSIVTTLANNAIIYLEIRTPANIDELAWKPSSITSDRVIKSEFFEAPTITTIGTNAVPTINQSRVSTNTASLLIFDNPSGISGGTLLRTRLHGAGTGSRPIATGAEDDTGWHLKKGTTYILKLTNIGGSASDYLNIVGQFFEITR